ncbi:transporter substrate-binding domain-containing protein [Bosea sp. 685]|uniref:transporter substrate-binding domain-containing protein n=1 Tax=Bosea sp. 685 TaxID=3080057 RepID=UPI002892CC43|nr:transporter substrate-binding domain-containing protein [Bosea sp. 685]WNJ87878.1 transporter substrate-binding domain-containing protein [Bosea sp. 685]
MSFTFGRRRFAAACFALAAAGAASIAHADAWDTIEKAKAIRVAIDPAAPPYSSLDSLGQYAGSEVEVAKRLASDLGLALTIVPTAPANRIPYLITGQADVVISTLSITDERKKVIEFSAPYSGIQIVVGAPKAAGVTSLADLVGKRVAVTRGSTNDTEITSNAVPGTNIIRFEDDATSITAVLSGQADAYVTAPALLSTVRERNPALGMVSVIVLKTNVTGIGVRKGENRLLEKVNSWVKGRLADNSLDGIYRKAFGEPLPKEVAEQTGR